MNETSLRQLLDRLAAGDLSVDAAVESLRTLPFEDLGFAQLDHHRALRWGFPEVIFCAGKTPEQVAGIVERLAARGPRVLGTRASIEQFDAARAVVPDLQYHALARCLWLDREPATAPRPGVVIAAAGTSDLPVVEEAALIQALKSGEYRFLRVNYANGDMVGHTGVLQAAIQSIETVDKCLNDLIQACEETGATLIVTADHGNCEEMIETDKKSGEPKKKKDGSYSAKTSHTLNPVPFLITGKDATSFISADLPDAGLSNIASTVLTLLGYEPPVGYRPSMVRTK